ncbi:MAG: hypothetical protein F4081_02650 [Dehalococcoidia bacterium]|nr:hypothetical protein [Dehalococcoidia bacterium]MYI85698.1 hypothetical protein [Dehalococcoidia bacterium]
MTRRHTRKMIRVYRDGDYVIEEEFPVVIADDGEIVVEAKVALKVEERQKHYLKLAERGELPEPSESGKGSHEAARG